MIKLVLNGNIKNEIKDENGEICDSSSCSCIFEIYRKDESYGDMEDVSEDNIEIKVEDSSQVICFDIPRSDLYKCLKFLEN